MSQIGWNPAFRCTSSQPFDDDPDHPSNARAPADREGFALRQGVGVVVVADKTVPYSIGCEMQIHVTQGYQLWRSNDQPIRGYQVRLPLQPRTKCLCKNMWVWGPQAIPTHVCPALSL